LNSPDTSADTEPVNERNWHEKVAAAWKAHPVGQEWRKQFTPQELEIIDRAEEAEMRWAEKAIKEDLPGPRRYDVMD
jgi:hypothetical protein